MTDTKKLREYTTNRLVFLEGKLLKEGMEYSWKDGELDLPDIPETRNKPIHVVHLPSLIKCEVLTIVAPEPKPSNEMGEVLERRMIVADWGVLMNCIDECPHEIEIYDLPMQLLLGFRCPTNGDTWLISIRNAMTTGAKGLDKLETRAQIVAEHSVRIRGGYGPVVQPKKSTPKKKTAKKTAKKKASKK